MDIKAPAPVSTADRIKSIDAIRGVALLGILLMNIPGFGINWDFWYPIVEGKREGSDYYTMMVIFTLFESTMRGLFSMLFGAGMVLFMMNKREIPGQIPVAEYYYRRLLWLVAFGLFNAFILLWQGDILFYYGLCGMLLFAFRRMKPKYLVGIALACVLFAAIKKQWNYSELHQKREAYKEAVQLEKHKKKLTNEQQAAITTWNELEKRFKPDSVEMARNEEKMQASYLTVFAYFTEVVPGFQIGYMYNDPWDMLCMMFLGMAMFGWGFFSNKLKTSTYTILMISGYAIGLPIAWMLFDNYWMGYQHPGQYADRWRSSHMVFFELRRIPITIGHASLIMLIFRSRLVPWLMKAMANVGQMAFSNYLLQSIICTLIFSGYGLGYYNKLPFHQLYYVVAGVWLFNIIFSWIWLTYFRFGPFEWLWRSLTYWKRQPMRK
jgi:uncharacterized protein